MAKKINSKEYWDERFASGDWEEKGGNTQTAYFYNVLLKNLPQEIHESFIKEDLTICDVGCAEGDGTSILQEAFKNCLVSGVDISDAAIDRAKQNYPHIDFKTKLNDRYDVVVSSNTLEHFENPDEHLKLLFSQSNKYVIILVPFEEYERVPEHFFTFEYPYFKMQYSDFSLQFFSEYDCYSDEPTFWEGKQILLVFQKNIDYHDITLNSLGVTSLLKQRDENIQRLWAENEALVTKYETEAIKNRLKRKDTEKTLAEKDIIIDSKNSELNTIYASNFWKVASKYHQLKEKPMLKPFVKVGRNLKVVGLVGTAQKVFNKSAKKMLKIKNEREHKRDLEDILQKYPDETIVILPMLVDWNIPLFQRPQHLAKNLAQQGYLYFYCTGNMQYDNVDGFKNISDKCYITNRFDLVDLIINRKKYYDLSSTDNLTHWRFVKDRLDKDDGIIYQYIDEISDDLSGFKIPKTTWEKHINILKDERCIVIPSATKLENDVKEHRSKNFKLVTNGVEIEHFSKLVSFSEYPEEIKRIVDKNKPIIGYFGAFATWFDYDLVVKLAETRPDLEIVLLGWDYDGSIKKAGFEQYENITVLGPIPYPQLPRYAACFDVSTIPFMINDITESTSPIKLFEYMAMGRPIVTTDMPECRKYASVLIGKSHEAFIQKIAEALALKDDVKYKELLKREASENSWESKARDIAELLS